MSDLHFPHIYKGDKNSSTPWAGQRERFALELIRGALSVDNFKTIIKLAKSESAFLLLSCADNSKQSVMKYFLFLVAMG